MNVSPLELQRACKALQDFCTRRNRSVASSQTELCCVRGGNDLLIRQIAAGGGSDSGRDLVRLEFCESGWRLYWQRRDGRWEPYPGCSWVNTVHDIIEQLEQDPLHIHWGDPESG